MLLYLPKPASTLHFFSLSEIDYLEIDGFIEVVVSYPVSRLNKRPSMSDPREVSELSFGSRHCSRHKFYLHRGRKKYHASADVFSSFDITRCLGDVWIRHILFRSMVTIIFIIVFTMMVCHLGPEYSTVAPRFACPNQLSHIWEMPIGGIPDRETSARR